jgi:hypothetical protein
MTAMMGVWMMRQRVTTRRAGRSIATTPASALLALQLRQLGDVEGDPPRFVPRESSLAVVRRPGLSSQ